MKNFFNSLSRNKGKTVIVIIVLIIIGYFAYKHWFTPVTPTRYVTAQASNQTIVVSVTGTGQVSQNHTVNIEPQSSGALTSVNVKQGEQVKAGQVIATVDEANNTIALNEAKAGVASAQANLASVLAGDTSQDIQLGQLAIAADQEALTNASTSLQTTERQDTTNVNNALTTLLSSNLQAEPVSSNLGNGTVTISGTYNSTQQGTYTINIYNTGGGLQYVVSGLENSTGFVNKVSPVPMGTRGLYMLFGGTIDNSDSWTVSIPNTLSSNYTSNYNAYQSALTTQANDITTGENQISSAENKLQQDQVNLQIKQLPPTSQAVQSAQASLTNAEAQLQNAQITYDNNILTAPFSGQVAELNNQLGDQVSPSTVVAVLTNNQSQAIIPLNEVDVATVKIGDKATMTFDAINNLTITGTVVEIDNIGTVTQGVVNYNVKIAFDVENPQVKPGMSVDAAIITDAAADVLSVPSSAIKTTGNSNYVQVLNPADTQTVPGETGVTSTVPPSNVSVQLGVTDGTNTQILSGLSAGATVVTQTISSATATKTTAASGTSVLSGLGGGGGSTFRAGAGGGGGFAGGGAGAGR